MRRLRWSSRRTPLWLGLDRGGLPSSSSPPRAPSAPPCLAGLFSLMLASRDTGAYRIYPERGGTRSWRRPANLRRCGRIPQSSTTPGKRAWHTPSVLRTDRERAAYGRERAASPSTRPMQPRALSLLTPGTVSPTTWRRARRYNRAGTTLKTSREMTKKADRPSRDR